MHNDVEDKILLVTLVTTLPKFVFTFFSRKSQMFTSSYLISFLLACFSLSLFSSSSSFALCFLHSLMYSFSCSSSSPFLASCLAFRKLLSPLRPSSQKKLVSWVVCDQYGQCDQKKAPKDYKSCPKMISLEKLKILKPLQKLPKSVGDLGKLIEVPQSAINRPIWSH